MPSKWPALPTWLEMLWDPLPGATKVDIINLVYLRVASKEV